ATMEEAATLLGSSALGMPLPWAWAPHSPWPGGWGSAPASVPTSLTMVGRDASGRQDIPGRASGGPMTVLGGLGASAGPAGAPRPWAVPAWQAPAPVLAALSATSGSDRGVPMWEAMEPVGLPVVATAMHADGLDPRAGG